MSDGYYDHARTDLLDYFTTAPGRLLDVGCGSGATGAAAKARWPGVTVIGIEVIAEAALAARERIDYAYNESAEEFNFNHQNAFDAVLLGDVIEHLVDPWAFLKRLRVALAPGAVIVASTPNVANFALIEQLADGRFDYTDDGPLDRTHLRFFTRTSLGRMFSEAGFWIERLDRVTDGRVDDSTRKRILGVMLPVPRWRKMIGRRVTISGVDRAAVEDLRTIGFVVRATLEGK